MFTDSVSLQTDIMRGLDDYCIGLVAPPSSVIPDLVPFITPAADMKLKHGVLGFLKHLAQPTPNKNVLGDAGVLEALATSNVWDRESDRAEAVQASAIGIAKHLCLNNGPCPYLFLF